MTNKILYYPAETIHQVIEAYNAGKSIDYIQRTFRIGFIGVKQILNDNSVELRPRSSGNYDINTIKQLAKEGSTKDQIIKQFGGSITALDIFLATHNLKWKDILPVPKYIQLKEEIIKLRTVDKFSIIEIVERLELDAKSYASVMQLLQQNNVPSLTLDEEYEAKKRRNLAKYGVEATSCLPEVKNKIKKSRQENKKEKIKGDLQFEDIDVKHFVYIFKRPDPTEDRYMQPFYVGKGKDRRPQTHITAARRGWKDNNHYKINTIRKYLKKDMLPIIEIIECKTEQEAYELEINLIAKWGRYGVDEGGILTNINPGGEGNTGGQRPVKQYNLFGEYIQTFPSCLEAIRSLGKENSSAIIECCKKKGSHKAALGYFWTYAEEELDLEWCFGGKKKPVYQWDLDGNFVNRFINASQAAKHLEKPKSSKEILQSTRLGTTCQQFQWTFDNKSPGKYNKTKKSHPNCMEVIQWSVDGNFIKKHKSFYEANLSLNKRGADNEISKGIKKNRITYGFRWTLEKNIPGDHFLPELPKPFSPLAQEASTGSSIKSISVFCTASILN